MPASRIGWCILPILESGILVYLLYFYLPVVGVSEVTLAQGQVQENSKMKCLLIQIDCTKQLKEIRLRPISEKVKNNCVIVYIPKIII